MNTKILDNFKHRFEYKLTNKNHIDIISGTYGLDISYSNFSTFPFKINSIHNKLFNANHTKLNNLPISPNDTNTISCIDNKNFTQINNLPKKLKILNCSDCENITTITNLPNSLKILSIKNTNIQNISFIYSCNLKTLYYNKIDFKNEIEAYCNVTGCKWIK